MQIHSSTFLDFLVKFTATSHSGLPSVPNCLAQTCTPKTMTLRPLTSFCSQSDSEHSYWRQVFIRFLWHYCNQRTTEPAKHASSSASVTQQGCCEILYLHAWVLVFENRMFWWQNSLTLSRFSLLYFSVAWKLIFEGESLLHLFLHLASTSFSVCCPPSLLHITWGTFTKEKHKTVVSMVNR